MLSTFYTLVFGFLNHLTMYVHYSFSSLSLHQCNYNPPPFLFTMWSYLPWWIISAFSFLPPCVLFLFSNLCIFFFANWKLPSSPVFLYSQLSSTYFHSNHFSFSFLSILNKSKTRHIRVPALPGHVRIQDISMSTGLGHVNCPNAYWQAVHKQCNHFLIFYLAWASTGLFYSAICILPIFGFSSHHKHIANIENPVCGVKKELPHVLEGQRSQYMYVLLECKLEVDSLARDGGPSGLLLLGNAFPLL